MSKTAKNGVKTAENGRFYLIFDLRDLKTPTPGARNPRNVSKVAKMAKNGQKWPFLASFLAIFAQNRLISSGIQVTAAKGGLLTPSKTTKKGAKLRWNVAKVLKNGPKMAQNRPKMADFGHFSTIFGHFLPFSGCFNRVFRTVFQEGFKPS